MGAREAGKLARKTQIIAAAEKLIRRHGDISFSMRELAQRAKVSPATPFNLFGSKGAVLWALLERDLVQQTQMIEADQATDPIDRVLGLARRAVEPYRRDEELYRPILSALVGSNPPEMPAILSVFTDLWRKALEEAEAQGQLSSDLNPTLLARQLHLEYRAGLTLWLRGEVDADGWALHVEHGVLLVLRGSMEPREAKKLHGRLVDVQRQLARLPAR